jgi:hypothetical protein
MPAERTLRLVALPEGGGAEVVVERGLADGEWSAEGESPSFRARIALGAASATGRRTIAVTIECRREVRAGVRLELELGRSIDPGWLVPGLVYGEFAPGGLDVSANECGFRADRTSTPAVFARDDAGGAALVTTEESPLGLSGVGLALRAGRPVLRLHFPYREEPFVYDGSDERGPAERRAVSWRPGDAASFDAALYRLGNGYAAVLRDVWARGRSASDPAWVSVEEAAELAAWGLYRWHYRPDSAVLVETAAFDREALGERGDRAAMHVSWVSGAPYAYALLRHARRRGVGEYERAATAVLDNIAANLAPGGTFWSQWTASDGWRNGWHPDRNRLHARTLGDATLFMLRAHAVTPHPPWEAAVRSNLDVVCRSQRDDGAFGAAYHAETGGVLSWDGTAGLAWVAPLAEAADVLHEPRYREAAERAGRFYSVAVAAGALCGAPEDVGLAPTSEDGYMAVIACAALRDWETAGRAADWMLTFRYTYDVRLPPHTLLGRYGFRTRGADQASPVNQHLHAFGLICIPELARLSRETGDGYYLEAARENLACFRQFVAREDGDFDAYRGMVSERYYQTDCFQAKGMLLTLSHAWSVGVLLLACEEALELGL